MTKKVNIEIDGNAKGIQSTLNALSAQLSSFGSNVEKIGSRLEASTGKVAQRISVRTVAIGNIIANVVGKAFSMLTSQMDNSIKRFDTLNNFSNVMANLGQNATKAGDCINYMAEYLTGLPTKLDDAASYVQKLTAANKNVEASTAIYLALNDAVLAGGMAMEKQKAAMDNLINAYSSGRLTAYQYRAVVEGMPAQLQQIAESMGYTSNAIGGDFYNALQDGTVSMNDFMKQVVKLDREGSGAYKSFAEQAIDATAGVQTAIANLKNAFTKMGTAIMTTLQENGAGIASILNYITSLIKTATIWVQAFITVLMKALNAVMGIFGGVKKSADKASGGVSGLASGAGDVSNNLKDATGNAKKLAQQLSKFDEMNVLKDQTASGAGNLANAGGGGVGDMTLPELDLSPASSKLEEFIANLEKLQPIFERVFGAMKEVAQRVWEQILKIDWFQLANILGNVIEIIVRYFGGIIEVALAVYNALAPSIEQLSGMLASKITPFVAKLVPHIEKIGEIVRPILSIAIDYLGKIIDALTSALDPVLSSIEKQLEKMRPFLEKTLKVAGELILKIINTLAGWDWGKILTVAGTLVGVKATLGGIGGLLGKAGSLTGNLVTGWNTFAQVANGVIGNVLNNGLPLLFENTSAGIKGIEAGSKTFLNLEGVFNSLKNAGMTAFTAILHPIQSLQGLLPKIGGLFQGLWGIISAHPFVAIGVALAALLMTNEDFRKSLMNMLNAVLKPILNLVKSLWSALQPLFTLIGDLVNTLMKPLTDLINQLVPPLTMIMDFIAQIATIIGGFIEELMPVISELVETMVSALVPIIEMIATALGAVMEILTPIIELVSSILAVVLPVIQGIVQFIMNLLLPILKTVISVISSIIEAITAVLNVVIEIVTGIVNIITEVITNIIGFFQGLWDALVSIFSPVIEFFGNLFNGARDAVVGAFSSIGNWFGDRVKDIKNAFNGIAQWFKGIFEGAWNAVKNVFASVGQFFQGIWNTIVGVFTKVGTAIGDAVSGAFKAVVNGILGFIEGFINTPINIINGFLDIINGAFGWIGVNIGHIPGVSLPRMARGGIVDKATLAMIGESGKEAVVPLENNTEWLDALADKLAETQGDGGTPIIVKIGEDTIIDTVIEKVREKSQIRNRNVMTI